MSEPVPSATHDLLAYIEDSPTPWHAVADAKARLDAAGWTEVSEGDADWSLAPGAKGYAIRDGGSIVAWRMGRKDAVDAGFRVVGAHTDSPNLRLKTRPSVTKEGFALLGVQTYGGVLVHTWFDRDLSLAGRVTVRTGSNPLTMETRLLRIDRPLCRIPNLAIHLGREVRTDGFKPNHQLHLPAVWGMASEELSVEGFLAAELGVAPEEILAWDMCLYDVQPPTVSGVGEDFIHAPRLDNLASTHASILAMVEADDADTTSVITLFDHEEIGSRTSRGAAGSMTRDILRRLAGDDAALARAVTRSMMVSADMAHGVHPNYADKHEAQHKPMLNGGPVIKAHADWKYASEGESMAAFKGLCEDHAVPVQDFVIRSDLACGSTIGPIVSSSLGMRTVDVGNAMWSMHSIREMTGSRDHPQMVTAMRAFLEWDQRI